MVMKILLLTFLCIISSLITVAQNKTLGVGTPTPTPNAALHVESPTSNQGFIMPRLTTLQRTAMGSLLATADNGLMLYDTDLKSIYFWNGTAWISSSQAASLTLPLAGTANSVSTAIDITNAGTGSAGNFTVNNAASSAAALTAGTNGTGNAITANGKVQASQFVGDGSLLTGLPVGGLTLPFTATNTTAASGTALLDIKSNPANAADIVNVANFENLNASALSNVVRITNAGNGATLVVSATGTGSGGLFTTAAGATFPALRGTTSGTGNAARFTVSNNANTVASLYGITNGTGPGVLGENTGTGNGPAGQFNVTNAANATPALNASTVGTGGAGYFYVGNPSNSTAALVGQTIGTGVATQGYTTGTGSAGRFEINNVANSSPALFATTNGTGNAIETTGKIQAGQFIGDGSLLTNLPGGGLTLPYFSATATAGNSFSITNNATTGNAGNFTVGNAASSGAALMAINSGQWRAADIQATNTTNPNSAMLVAHSGLGIGASFASGFNASNSQPTINAQHYGAGAAALLETTGTTSASTALVVNTAGIGSSAQFNLFNALNTSSAITVTHSGTGNAITANRPIQATQFIGDGSLLTGISGGLSLPYTGSSNSTSTTFNITNTAASGIAGSFTSNDVSNFYPAFEATSAGGPAGSFQISNSTNGSNAVSIGQQGLGRAAVMQILNPLNASTALYITNNGSGISVDATTTGTGSAGSFSITNPASSNRTLIASTDGTGGAGGFLTSNAANSNTALTADTNGTGLAFGATASASSNAGAGQFDILNSANTKPAIKAQTNGTGPAIQLIQSNNGAALNIAQGGITISTFDVGSGTVINTRAGAYRTIGGGPAFTIGYTLNEGDLFFVVNPTGSAVTINTLTVGAFSGATFIYLFGALRTF